MLGLKAAKTDATTTLRRAMDNLKSALSDADDCVTQIQMRGDHPGEAPVIHPMRRQSDRQRR
jgi:hypothetical protein